MEEREELHRVSNPGGRGLLLKGQPGSEEDATPNGVRTLYLKDLGPSPGTTYLYLPWLIPARTWVILGPGTQPHPSQDTGDPGPRDPASSPAFQEFGPLMKSQL